jgi:tetratricopeptide (TPR) repeat protein
MEDRIRDSGALIGRERELEQLDAALSDAIDGRGALVVVTGEAGIGKTTLARAFAEHAATRGASSAWGTCWDGGGAPVYWPWVQIARAIVRGEDGAVLRGGLGANAPWIAGLLPELGGVLGAAAAPSDLNADQARFRLFDALAGLLASAAARGPLVVVFDDLQWSDASSVHALEFVGRALPDLPVLVIAAYRPSEAHARGELAAALGGLARVARRLPLEGLDRDGVGRLAIARAHGRQDGEPSEISGRLVAAVHHASAGNPFFVDELLQLLASQGRLYDTSAAEPLPLPLPGGVRDTILRRLSPLAEDCLQMLRAAAVIGAEFSFSTVARMVRRTPNEVLERLDSAQRAGLLVTGHEDPGRFVFVHTLVRDTLLSGIGAVQRGNLHLQAAEALEQVYADDLDPHLSQIANHFVQAASAGGAQRAVEYASRAADRAIGQFAYEEAALLYARSIEIAATLPADPQLAWRLHHGHGEALMRAGDIPGSRRALRAAAEHARGLDDPAHLAQSALAGTLPGLSPGAVDPELVAVLEEALERMDQCASSDAGRRMRDDDLRCRLRIQLAVGLYWSSQRERRDRLVDEGLAIAREIFTAPSAQASPAQRALVDRTLAFALAQGFLAVWGPDTVERGLPISVEALELCEGTGDSELAMQVRLWRVSLLLELDDPVRCDAEIEAFGSIARRLGQPRTIVFDALYRSMRAHMRGEFDEAERHTAESVRLGRAAPGSVAPILADAQAFFQLRTRGRHLDFEPLLRGHADRLPAMRRWRCLLALLLAELGREEEARNELEQFAASDFEDLPADGGWLVTVALLGELSALLGDVPRACRLYALLAPYEGRNVVAAAAAYLGPVARYLGLLAMTTGDAERALGHLETARSAAERIGARPTAVLSALDTAEVLTRRGAPDDAQRAMSLVERATGQADLLEMDGARTRAADLRARLARHGAHPPAEPQEHPLARLSRERDVWMLDHAGRSLCLQDAKGLHHLATLLARPGTSIEAAVLAHGGAEPAAGRAQGALQERSRVNVTRSLRAVVRKIAEHDPELGRMLQATIRTGASCAYEPDPDHALHWEVRT